MNSIPSQPLEEFSGRGDKEIRIGDYMLQNLNTENTTTVKGNSAQVTFNNTAKPSIIPGFVEQKINIKTNSGAEFNLTLHIQSNTDSEGARKLTDKLTRVISNLPIKILEDMKEEVKYITICPTIIHNRQAKAMAVGELNQIFLSIENTANLTEKEIEETLIHEIGHLLDRLEGMFAGKGSRYVEKDFLSLKKLATENLGFNTDTYALSKSSEMFAEYYLYKFGNPNEQHRCMSFFNKLEQYRENLSKLNDSELETIYGENTESIKNLTRTWVQLKNQFDKYINNVQSGDYERASAEIQPRSIEQMLTENNTFLN